MWADRVFSITREGARKGILYAYSIDLYIRSSKERRDARFDEDEPRSRQV